MERSTKNVMKLMNQRFRLYFFIKRFLVIFREKVDEFDKLDIDYSRLYELFPEDLSLDVTEAKDPNPRIKKNLICQIKLIDQFLAQL